ncbi:MAG: hypothetical protein GY906_28390 [bacterium]|nr:hypothetical protein [bacterium]
MMRNFLAGLRAEIYRRKVLVIMVLVVIVAVLASMIIAPEQWSNQRPPDAYGIHHMQKGPFVLIDWNDIVGAVVYEVQGRMFDNEWNTFQVVTKSELQKVIPPGVSSYRVRAWSMHGPMNWSKPSGYMLFIPRPPTQQPEKKANPRDQAQLLPWTEQEGNE